jgi:hypothetical protein
MPVDAEYLPGSGAPSRAISSIGTRGETRTAIRAAGVAAVGTDAG